MNQAKLTRIQQISVVVIILIAIMHPIHSSRFTSICRNHEAKLALQALATSKGSPVQWSGEALYLAFTSGIFCLFDQTNFTSAI